MWKTFRGKCIYKSAKGTQVFQNILFRWLKFNSNALQTLLNRYFPHRPGLYYIKLLTVFARLKPAECCMFGLGGAGAAHSLNNQSKQKLTVIEYDEEIIEISKRFFMLDTINNLEVIHQDAQLFAKETKRTFDHILIDLFTADSFPHQCNTEEFFSNCRRILTDNGILAINLAYSNEQWPILQLIKTSFSYATITVPVQKSANIIIYATKTDSIDSLLETLKHNKKLKQVFWDAKWGCVAEVTL